MDEFTRLTVRSYRTELLDDFLGRGDEYAEPFASAFEVFCERVETTTNGRPRVLDVGCGPGEGAALMTERGHRVLGIDLVPEFLRATRECTEKRADVSRMDMRTLALEDGVVDAVWASASFYHVPRDDARRTVSEFSRVLQSGGPLLCGVHRGEGTKTLEDGRRATLWPADDFTALFREAGFTIDRLDESDELLFLHATA